MAYLGFFLNQGVLASYTLFVLPIEQSLGRNHFLAVSVYSMALAAQAVTSPVIGRLVTRFSARVLFAAGGAVAGLGLVWAGAAASYPALLIAYGVAGIGLNAIGLVVGAPLAGEAFPRQRGLMVGLLSTGTGLAALVVVPLTGLLIHWRGWRLAFTALGMGLPALMVPVALKWLPHDPAPSAVRSALTPERIRLDLSGWLLVGAFFATAFASFANWVVLAPTLAELSVPFGTVALAVSAAGAVSGAGRLLFGYLADRWRPVTAGLTGYGISIAGCLALLALPRHAPHLAVFSAVVLFGVSFGGRTPVFATIAARRYGAQFAKVWGWILLGQGVGGALGPACAGWVSQWTGSYQADLAPVAALYVVAAVLLVVVARIDHHPQAAARAAGLEPNDITREWSE
ncbi:MAG: MFS transporter [Thermaerobacter sp.]|nr:MFS transporter [Thermaerobacter sp.]